MRSGAIRIVIDKGDADDAGMPNAWEQAHGLDPNDGSDHGKVMQSGYMAIEEYRH